MRTVVAAVVAGLLVSAAPALAQEPVPDPAEKADKAEKVEQIAQPAQPDRPADLVLAVEGFSCDACTAKLQEKLSEIDGAEAVVAAPWEEGTVSVWLAPDAEVEDEAIANVVTNAGFVLKEVRRTEAEAAS